MEEKKEKIQRLSESILNYAPHSKREDLANLLSESHNLIAEIATDIAIKATTDQFILKIKEAATEGAAMQKENK